MMINHDSGHYQSRPVVLKVSRLVIQCNDEYVFSSNDYKWFKSNEKFMGLL